MADTAVNLEQLADTDLDAALKGMQETEREPVEAAPEPEQETVKPEIVQEAPVEPKADGQKTVDLAALHAERRRRQEAEERNRKLEESLRELAARLAPPAPPSPRIPEYSEDPIEHLRAKTEMTEAQLADLVKQRQQDAQALQQRAQRDQFVGWYQKQAQEFAAQQADFGEAYKHTVTRMGDILRNASDNPREVAQALEAWETGVVRRAAAEGRNPAAAIYEVAQGLGYSAPKPQEEPQNVPESLEVIERGVAATKSSGGGDAEPKMTLERLANLSGAAFDKAWEKMQKEGLLG
jgi:hypothetical protein